MLLKGSNEFTGVGIEGLYGLEVSLPKRLLLKKKR